MNFIKKFKDDSVRIIEQMPEDRIDEMVDLLGGLRDRNGRLFILGVGGSAANCSHAVNDFRKLCKIEAYSPADNVSELTARINDDGWEGVFVSWLEASNLSPRDMILVFSVGGGDESRNVSVNIVNAIKFATKMEVDVISVVGRSEGFAANNSTVALVVPQVDSKLVTPYSEAFQAWVWHLLVSHPKLQMQKTKW